MKTDGLKLPDPCSSLLYKFRKL